MKIFIISVLVIISALSILFFINHASTELTEHPGLQGNPDLIISSIKIFPSSPTSNSLIRAAIKCKNIGGASIAPELKIDIIYEVFKEEVNAESGEKRYVLIKEKKGVSFVNFAIARGAETIEYSFAMGRLRPGNYRIDFTCDAFSLLKEISKSNNTTAYFLTIPE